MGVYLREIREVNVFFLCLLTGLGFIAASIYVVWESGNLEYYTPLGPGGGFFPFWLGIIMAGLTFGWLIQEIRNKDIIKSPLMTKDASITRVILPIVALVGVSVFINTFGFQITMFLFLIILLKILGKQNFFVSLVVALLGSFGVYHIFTRFLDVTLPVSSIKFLSNLGI